MANLLQIVLLLGLTYEAITIELQKHMSDKIHQTLRVKTDGGKETGRIVGGSNADRGEYPWLISLSYNGVFKCGGSILDENTILTAAHCVNRDPEQRFGDFSIKAGDYRTYRAEASEQLRNVKQVIMHEKYNKKAFLDRDVAILKLANPLKLKKYVQKISLANKAQEKELLSRSRCLVAGIGDVETQLGYRPIITQEFSASVPSRKMCLQAVKQFLDSNPKSFTSYMLCSLDVYKGVCSGDSGGPLTCYDEKENPFQIGIVSWHTGCSTLGLNGYARVSYLKGWIKKHI